MQLPQALDQTHASSALHRGRCGAVAGGIASFLLMACMAAPASAHDDVDRRPVGPAVAPAAARPVATGASAGEATIGEDASTLGGAAFSPFAEGSPQAHPDGPDRHAAGHRGDEDESGFGATFLVALGGVAALMLCWRRLSELR